MALPAFIQGTRRRFAVPAQATGDAVATAATTAAGSQPRKLDYPPQPQRWSQWCWAAVAVGVARCYDSSSQWEQCSVAADVLGRACCNGAFCNEKAGLGSALDVVGHRDTIAAQPMSLAEVRDEIDAGRPVCVRQLIGGQGHVVAIYGYLNRNGRQFVFVADPAHRTSMYEFHRLDTRSRPWTHTYTTQR